MHISIIDDEKILGAAIMKKLKNTGYSASYFSGFDDFIKNGDDRSHLYIVDIGLGDGSGFDIIKWLRDERKSSAPVIIISGYGNTEKIIYGLDIGADDYITKPFSPEELLARVKAVLRRPRNIETSLLVKYKGVVFSPGSKEIKIGGNSVYLTKNEGLILEILLKNVGKLITREELIIHVWGGCNSLDVSDNTINVTLSNIRKKIAGYLELKTLYNQGFIIE